MSVFLLLVLLALIVDFSESNR